MSKLFSSNLIIKVTSPKMKQRFEATLLELGQDMTNATADKSDEPEVLIADSKREVDLVIMRCRDPIAFANKVMNDARILARFISQIYLVNAEVKTEDDIAAYVNDNLQPGTTINIRMHPKSATRSIAELIEAKCPGIKTSPRVPETSQTLHVCRIYSRFAIALSPHSQVCIPDAWSDDSLPLVVCRAIFKIREAFYNFNRALNPAQPWDSCLVCGQAQHAPGSSTCRAVDIGASPGGWSFWMASRGLKVASVDPGEVSVVDPGREECSLLAKARREAKAKAHFDRLKVGGVKEEGEIKAETGEIQKFDACACANPNACAQAAVREYGSSIKHWQMKMEDAEEGVAEWAGMDGLGLIVCDVNMDPRMAANMILRLCMQHATEGVSDRKTVLRRGCKLILTLKEVSSGLLSVYVKQVSTALEGIFDIVDVRRLLSNGLECTMCAVLNEDLFNSSQDQIVAKLTKAVDHLTNCINEAYAKHGHHM